ncbi:MAG: hypothetical protein ACFCU7_17735 [Pleurocapsa sp.]
MASRATNLSQKLNFGNYLNTERYFMVQIKKILQEECDRKAYPQGNRRR